MDPIDPVYAKQKRFFPCLSEEPLVHVWDTVTHSIETTLDGKFRTIDLFRVGYVNDAPPEYPATILIGVDYDIIDFYTAEQCILSCKSLLFSLNITNVDIEIKEAIHETQSTLSYTPLSPYKIVDEEAHLHFTTSLGQSISTSEASAMGTMGLYLYERGSNNFYGLTSGHIPFPPFGPKECYAWSSTEPAIQVYQPGTGVFNDTLQRFKEAIDDWQERLTTGISNLRDRKMFDTPAERIERMESQIQTDETQLKVAQEHYNSYAYFSDLDERNIGHVVCTSSYSTQNQGALQDWSIIALNRKKYNNGVPPINEVYLGDTPEMKNYAPRVETTLKLKGICSMEEATSGTRSEGPMVVGKRGYKTGLTWGQVNGTFSLTRSRPQGEISSREIAVLGKKGAFSQPGDSGAIVFCRDGRVIGPMNGGTPGGNQSLESDVSYVTPIESCLGSIEAQFRKLEIA